MTTTQSFGAYLQCYKNPMATYKCLESFRNHYPTNTIVLLSDNGYDYTNMAKYFNCIYIHSNENVPLCNRDFSTNQYINNVFKIIERFNAAFNLIKEDYVMSLEDDVSINGKITDVFNYDINGFCPNTYNSNMINGLNPKYTHIRHTGLYRWSGHGGCVFHKNNILRYFENTDIILDVLINWQKYHLTEDICHDFLFSLLVNLNGGTIGPYEGHFDCGGWLNLDIKVQHQYKVWYGLPLPQELQYLCNKNT
jgi:hypothetical protein